jgi:hypothetical protein
MSDKSLLPLIWTAKETAEVKTILADASQLWFPKGFGFDPFSVEQIQQALTDPLLLQFRLNKVKGRGILYGVRHAALRRRLANLYPDDTRSKLWQQRLSHAGIWTHIRTHYQADQMVISDIGMGHTVLHFHMPDTPDTGFVLKQEELPHHRLFCQILQTLGWANLHSEHTVAQHLGWQISPYIPGETVSQWTAVGKPLLHTTMLAQFAALGDLIGREDRHNENYIVGPQGCLPIDTAALYGNHNETWLSKYVAGGIYEISTLAPTLWENPYDTKPLQHFLTTYADTHTALSQWPLHRTVAHLSPTPNTQNQAFITARQSPVYREERLNHYREALKEMIKRLAYRKLLDHIWENTPQHLNAHPILKMYALAHETRLATFFLAEERPWVFESISALADQLGLQELLTKHKTHAHRVVTAIGEYTPPKMKPDTQGFPNGSRHV